MNKAKRKALDKAIRNHAQAMYNLGACGGDYEEDQVVKARATDAALNALIDGVRKD
jgi:hypothetical protein